LFGGGEGVLAGEDIGEVEVGEVVVGLDIGESAVGIGGEVELVQAGIGMSGVADHVGVVGVGIFNDFEGLFILFLLQEQFDESSACEAHGGAQLEGAAIEVLGEQVLLGMTGECTEEEAWAVVGGEDIVGLGVVQLLVEVLEAGGGVEALGSDIAGVVGVELEELAEVEDHALRVGDLGVEFSEVAVNEVDLSALRELFEESIFRGLVVAGQ